jgi:integrase/recombinase XerD
MIEMTDLIEAYAERLRAAGRSHYTISARSRILRHAARVLPHGLDEASGDEITAFLAARKKNWTKLTYYSALHSYFMSMIASGKLDYDPTTAVPRPQAGDSTPNPVTTEELFTALDRSPDRPWRPAIVLGAYAGLRCGEIVGLHREDVTVERLHVRRGKGGRARFIPTHPEIWRLVRDLPPGAVVRGVWGHAMTPEKLTSAQSAHWQSIGMAGIHLHRFRHWFGTTLVDQGVGIEVVRELMGHRSIATTQGYVRVSQAKRDAAIVQLPGKTPEPVSTRLGRTTEAA